MKNLFTALLLSFSLSSFANVITCEDFYAREFRGVIEMEFKGQFASRISYAENKKDFLDLTFTRVNPNHQTRGNSEYFVEIPGIFKGILKMRLDGDVLLYNQNESFFLSCDN